MSLIESDFENIRDKFNIRCSSLGIEFDYDVFADTMMKCHDCLLYKDMSKECAIAYFWVSFKNNLIRSTANNLTDRIDDDFDCEIDVFDNKKEILENMICDKFGTEMYGLILEHANGSTYDDFKEYDKLKYKFRKVREFVKANWEF